MREMASQFLQSLRDEEGQGIYIGGGALLVIVVVILIILLA